MVRKARNILGILLSVFLFPVIVFAYSSGPPDAHTRPPDTCTHCHKGSPLNSGGGLFQLVGVPTKYTPLSKYPITVKLEQKGQKRWGFELKATAGTILIIDSTNTQVSANTYLKQTLSGTYAGNTSGAIWSFKWQAPSTSIDTIIFYAAGNAANNDNSKAGDYIYTTIVTTYRAGRNISRE
ncbi:MAG: hypothetical protein QME64_07635 [bacterium]|nr:hypothetical protein [bacterium]